MLGHQAACEICARPLEMESFTALLFFSPLLPLQVKLGVASRVGSLKLASPTETPLLPLPPLLHDEIPWTA